jgi:hypothetical protein
MIKFWYTHKHSPIRYPSDKQKIKGESRKREKRDKTQKREREEKVYCGITNVLRCRIEISPHFTLHIKAVGSVIFSILSLSLSLSLLLS